LPIFADGAAGIDELSRRFDELGGGLSQDTVDGANAADDALNDFDLSLRSLKGTLVTSVLPTISSFISTTATLIGTLVNTVRTSSLAQTAIGALAVAFGTLAIAALPVIAPTVALVAALALLYLAGEDVVTAFRGGDSVFATWEERLASALGVSLTFQGQIEAMGNAWKHLKADALDALASVLSSIASVRTALGMPADPALARMVASVRASAGSAHTAAAAGDTELMKNEAGRVVQRARNAASDAIALAQPGPATLAKAQLAAGGRATSDRAASAAKRQFVHQQNEINVHGVSDPAEAARMVDQRLQQRLQEAQDSFPSAEDDEGEGD
jgi:hypothetical protein